MTASAADPTTAAAGPARPKDARPLAILAALVGLYGWLVFAMAFGHDGVIGPYYNAPGGDYMVYWRAVRSALSGDFALLNDPVALTDRLNTDFRFWLTRPMPLHPWLYPPHYLLALLPFAWLPFFASYAAFQAVTFAAAVLAAWCWAGPNRRYAYWLIGLALAPAATVTVIEGQNAFLSLALLLGGIGLLGRSAIAAGVLLGLLSYKPQFAILVPVALIAAGQWRALAAAAAAGALAVLASAAVFGVAPWTDWIGRMAGGGGPDYAAWVEAGRLWGLSIWTCATLLGAPGWLANAAQMLAALGCAVAVWVAFRRPIEAERRMAVLLVATLLAAPHCSPYDLMLLAAAVLLLFRAALDGAAPSVRLSLLLLPWAAPLAPVPRVAPSGFGVPLLMVALLVVLAASPAVTGRRSAL